MCAYDTQVGFYTMYFKLLFCKDFKSKQCGGIKVFKKSYFKEIILCDKSLKEYSSTQSIRASILNHCFYCSKR